ncbi:hypothetical protein ABLE91_02170 [Aquabacter sp. CN5-332]|uniref:hypothetical protein n=1 Tax=Aquabacter sp. CN5-332 TaxID=3156608 RepID=UPI0032B34A28
MRDLGNYSLRDWMGAMPLAHGARRLRNMAVDRVYGKRQAEGQAALLAELSRFRGEFLVFTVAFNMPEAIAFLSQAMARAMPGLALVVCDNSTDPAARARIAALCTQEGRLYCPMPAAPQLHSRPNGSRSHGVALNWIWRNLIRPTRPRGFALIDHDLIPLAADDLSSRLAHQPVYGMVRKGERFGGWFLWPGYSLFDFAAVEHLPLDFGTDTPLTLDTGGQNWRVLYRDLSLPALDRAQTWEVMLPDPDTGEPEPFLLVDTWLHVGGAGHRGGGAAALERARRAYAADPEGLLGRLMATAQEIP